MERKNMKNVEIYDIAIGFSMNFNEELILPIKVNFYLLKNKNKFIQLGQQIEEMKATIYNKYGTYDEESQNYKFEPEVIDEVNKELTDLMLLDQEVEFYTISLKDFGDINISSNQLSTLEFMIKEE